MDLKNNAAGHNNSASDAALDLLKQLITLASGVLALSATFLGKFGSFNALSIGALSLSWFTLMICVGAGLQAISAIVKSRMDDTDAWGSGYAKKAGQISKWCFGIGIFLFVIFASLSLSTVTERKSDLATLAEEISSVRNLDSRLEAIELLLKRDSVSLPIHGNQRDSIGIADSLK